MSDTELDRSVLDSKDREELHQIAGAMGVNAATRMKKADLIDAILGAVDGGASDGKDAADGGDRPKRVRSRRASEADDPIAELAAEEEAIAAAGEADDAAEEPRPVSRTTSSSTGDGGGDAASGDGASQGTATTTKDSNDQPRARGGNGGGTATKPRIEPEDER